MIEDSDSYNWIIAPIGNCIKFIIEEIALASLIQRSMAALKGAGPLLSLAREQLLKAKKQVAHINSLLAEQPYLDKSANDLIDSDFDSVNSHSLIGMWGAIEIAVEDTIVLILMKDESAVDVLIMNNIKTIDLIKGAISEVDGRRLFSKLERSIRSKLPVGKAYSKMLEIFGLNINCSLNTLEKLNEVNSVRNCLLHRGGFLDEKAIKECPLLKPYTGRKFIVSRKLYLEYYEAIEDFAKSFVHAAAKSKYVRIKQSN
ncbi:MAG: hypothetical protein V1844_26320 [Pseudomonadota bacterium]